VEKIDEVTQTLDILTECLDLIIRGMQQNTYTHNDAQPIAMKIAAARRHIKQIKKMEG